MGGLRTDTGGPMCGFWVSDHSNLLLLTNQSLNAGSTGVSALTAVEAGADPFSWFCRLNMNKALRLTVIWQTMLFAILFVVTGYLYHGAAVTAAMYCAPITMQNSTADTPSLHLGPDTTGALHHVVAPHSLTERLC